MNGAKIAWAGSAFLMLGALYFQYFQGLDPCVLCIYQRIPHIAVLVLGVIAIWLAPQYTKFSYPLMGLIILAGAGIAMFHVGVEQHWWEGLSTCTASTSASLEDLMGKKAARCDEIAWSFLGLSMAAWNGIASLGIAGLWVRARKVS